MLDKVRRFLVARVNKETIAQRQAAAGRDRLLARFGLRGLGLIVVPAEGIRTKEAVITSHPPRGMLDILGMIKDRDAVGLAVFFGVVVAPIGALAPGFGIAVTLRGHDVTGAARLLLHCFTFGVLGVD